MPNIPPPDPSADYQFVSRSAGNTPERIKAALEGEGIFVKDISEQTDDVPAKAPEPVVAPAAPKDSEAVPPKEEAEPKPGDAPVPAAERTEEQKKADEERKARPGRSERLKQKVEALTSESLSVKAERDQERQKRESLERELADLRAGKSIPAIEPRLTPPTVEKTEEKPAEARPKPKRPATPKEEDFWEKEDAAGAYKTALAAHETALETYDEALTDWKLDERERVRREAEISNRQKEAADNFKAQNEADQKARVERYNSQREELKKSRPDRNAPNRPAGSHRTAMRPRRMSRRFWPRW